ncbi:MAG: hypothetical protein K1X47_06310 [Cyclobacteriaceae bacterium]|nr:hypothetical protein [Cyclobacteriaceae bacterium]
MKRLGILLVWMCASALVHAQQFPFDYWYEGKVVLEAGDTLRGNVKYNLEDLLQVELKGRLETFSARKVIFFEIYDTKTRRYRSFYSLPFSATGGYKAPVFFELLAEGKMTLLTREALEYRTYNGGFYYYGSTTRLVLVNKFYFLKENGDIEPFTGNKNDFLYLAGNKDQTMQKYMKQNKLGVTDKYQFASIVQYYNSLFPNH